MNEKKAFVVIAITTTLAVLGSASTAASKAPHTRGGVLPCSLDGVNPVFHPEIFGNPAVAAREYGFVKSADGTWHVRPGCHR